MGMIRLFGACNEKNKWRAYSVLMKCLYKHHFKEEEERLKKPNSPNLRMTTTVEILKLAVVVTGRGALT